MLNKRQHLNPLASRTDLAERTEYREMYYEQSYFMANISQAMVVPPRCSQEVEILINLGASCSVQELIKKTSAP